MKENLKRLFSEISELSASYPVRSYFYKDIVSIEIKNIRLVFPDTYPFKPPQIYVDGLDWCAFTTNISNFHFLKKYNDGKCLCCHSKIQGWGPTQNIIAIIDEVEHITKIKTYILTEELLSSKLPVEMIHNINSYY